MLDHYLHLQKAYPGKFHVGLDGWTSPNVISFLGVVLYFMREAELTSMILDFVKLSQSHTGRYLCDSLVDCLKEFGIENKILGVVCNNTSNNDTLVSQLELDLCRQNGTRTRIRCFVHILNLAVKAILSPFSGGASNDDNNESDMDSDLYDVEDDKDKDKDDETEEGREESDLAVIGDIADKVDPEILVSAAQLAVVKSALSKVCSLVSVWN